MPDDRRARAREDEPVESHAGAFASALLRERSELRGQLASLDNEAQIARWGDTSFDDDIADQGSVTVERDRMLSMSGVAGRLLTAIDEALERMDDGTYGTCQTCTRRIKRQRLETLPHAALCINCKQEEERRR